MIDIAREIAKIIEDDVLGRKGLGNSLEECDEDIREEILSTWTSLIQASIDLSQVVTAYDETTDAMQAKAKERLTRLIKDMKKAKPESTELRAENEKAIIRERERCICIYDQWMGNDDLSKAIANQIRITK